MARIGHIPEIIAVKNKLESLKQQDVVTQWELPYENLLTRLTAAIFFLDCKSEEAAQRAWNELTAFPLFRQRENTEKKLSQLKYRVEFSNADGTF